MCKFKFGAMVTTKAHGVGVVVRCNSDKKECFVLIEGGTTLCWFAEDEVSPIPHPDTLRLDFLLTHGGYIEAPNGIQEFYVGKHHAIYGDKVRVREVLDMVIDKKKEKANAETKGHLHAKLMEQYAQDAKTNERPWELWEVYRPVSGKWVTLEQNPVWSNISKYRRKKTSEK